MTRFEACAATEGERGRSIDLDDALLTDAPLTEKERAYRCAQRLADEKLALSREGLRAALITIPLLVFVPPAGVIALVYFTLRLGRRAFKTFYEPELHQRFVDEEIERQVRGRVVRERRDLEGAHHRSLERLSASIAHEIRNPITAAKSLVQQMGEDASDVDQEEYARIAVAELERVERSIQHLLRHAREQDTQITQVVMEDVLESALETFRDRARRAGIEIIRRYDAPGRLDGDPEQLRRVVIHLVSNAIDALESAKIPDPEIEVSMGESLAGSEVWVRVTDNGSGIDAPARERIFAPSHTRRAERTGLGLALCREIVDRHAGQISVESPPPGRARGTELMLVLPSRRAATSGSEEARR